MLCSHAVADYALQTDMIAANKNRNHEPKGYDPVRHGPKQVFWPYVLTGHALIHGLGVYLITQSTLLGLLETAAHWAIDFGKCEKWYGINTDQWLHIGCKILWVILFVYGIK
jgi:hypothetical protein